MQMQIQFQMQIHMYTYITYAYAYAEATCVHMCGNSRKNRHGAYTCLDAVYTEESVFIALAVLIMCLPSLETCCLFFAGLILGAAVLA